MALAGTRTLCAPSGAASVAISNAVAETTKALAEAHSSSFLAHSTKSNIYLFRHISTNKVVVSDRFDLEDSVLNQVGENRPNSKVRRDHWIPFCAVTGITNPYLRENIVKDITTYVTRKPKHAYKPNDSLLGCYTPWTPSNEMREKISLLCKSLGKVNIAKDLKAAQETRTLYLTIISQNPDLLHLAPTFENADIPATKLRANLISNLKGKKRARVQQLFDQNLQEDARVRIEKVAGLTAGLPGVQDVIQSEETLKGEGVPTEENVLSGITVKRSAGATKVTTEELRSKFESGKGVLPQLEPWTVWWETMDLANAAGKETVWPDAVVHRKMTNTGSVPNIPNLSARTRRDVGHYVIQYPRRANNAI